MMNKETLLPDARIKALWHLINFMFLILGLAFIWIFIPTAMNVTVSLIFTVMWLVIIFIPLAVYIPAYFHSLEYSLEDDAIRLKKGVFWRRVTTVPYAKITNIDITQGPLERLFNVSKLHIQTAGFSGNQATHAELMMVGICNAEDLKEQIMNRLRTRIVPANPIEATPKDDTQLLQDILSELTSIHNTLSKK